MIGYQAFAGCGSLSKVTFESDSELNAIAAAVFQNCPSLSSICIPSSLERIFCQYPNILKITVDEGSRVGVGSGSAPDAARTPGTVQ
jgi:hypothetical protein